MTSRKLSVLFNDYVSDVNFYTTLQAYATNTWKTVEWRYFAVSISLNIVFNDVLCLLQRSALAYRRDSSIDGYINRTNVGISTTSTTSRSTSKSSGGLYKGDDYLRSTDTSTSGHAPSYAYDNAYHQKSGEGQCFDFFWKSVLFVFEGTNLPWWDRCFGFVIVCLNFWKNILS